MKKFRILVSRFDDSLTATRKEISNSIPIQRNESSNTQSVRQRHSVQSNHQLEQSVQPTVQHIQNMECSDRNSES